MQSKGKKSVDQISFVLQNIFIVHPNSNSKYKIRIIVNRNTSDPSFRKISNRYIFKLDPSNPQLKEKACFLVLLEKSKKEGSSNQYTEIGKAAIDLSEVVQDTAVKSETVINGVVYGTRSYNYDRIIGKYSYKVYKAEGTGSPTRPAKPEKIQKQGKPISGTIKKKEKGNFLFKQSIMQQERHLQSKIKELTDSMNKIMSANDIEIEEPYEKQHIGSTGLIPIQEAALDESQYYYKYSDKLMEQLSNLQTNTKQLSTLVIKNIRVDSRRDESQQKMMLETVKVQNPKANPPKKTTKLKQMQEVLLIFYELLEERKVRKRVLQVYLPIYLNKDNRNLAHQLLYLPRTNNKILLELAFVTDSFNKYKSLNGVIQASVAKSRLLELYDLDNQEKGIVVCHLDSCTEVDKQEIKSYKKQVPSFDRALRRHADASQLVKKPALPPIRQEPVQKAVKTLDNSAKDTLYSNFHENKEVKNIKPKRYSTSFDQNSGHLELKTPSGSRFNRSETTSKHNLNSSKNSTRFFSKSIRAFPNMLESVVKDRQEGFISNGAKYRLYIESGQFSLYDTNEKGRQMLVKLSLKSQKESKRVVLGQAEWVPLHVQFRQFRLSDWLGVELLLNKRNTTTYKKAGSCNIVASELQTAQNKYKAYLSRHAQVIGYVVFKFKLFKKEADQKSQSFYYQQDFDRHSLVRSDRSAQDPDEPYTNLDKSQGLVYRSQSERSFREDPPQQFEVSFESKQIQAGGSTKLHDVSQRMSDGRVSQELENEDYQNGQAIHRRF